MLTGNERSETVGGDDFVAGKVPKMRQGVTLGALTPVLADDEALSATSELESVRSRNACGVAGHMDAFIQGRTNSAGLYIRLSARWRTCLPPSDELDEQDVDFTPICANMCTASGWSRTIPHGPERRAESAWRDASTGTTP